MFPLGSSRALSAAYPDGSAVETVVYAILGGALIAALEFVEYRFLLLGHSLEIHGGIRSGTVCESGHLAHAEARGRGRSGGVRSGNASCV